MQTRKIFAFSAVLGLCVFASTASAQVGQLNGGTTAGGGGANAAPEVGAGGSVSEGFSGTTTQGITSDPNGGQAGANAATEFIGGGGQGFVGGGAGGQQNNSNRQFQSLTNQNTPTGRTQQTSGNPRRVPVKLKVSFAVPAGFGSSITIGNSRSAISRIANVRPELSSVSMTLARGGVAVLRGTVPSSDAARLAANLIRLEPGVKRVDNQLRVARN